MKQSKGLLIISFVHEVFIFSFIWSQRSFHASLVSLCFYSQSSQTFTHLLTCERLPFKSHSYWPWWWFTVFIIVFIIRISGYWTFYTCLRGRNSFYFILTVCSSATPPAGRHLQCSDLLFAFRREGAELMYTRHKTLCVFPFELKETEDVLTLWLIT